MVPGTELSAHQVVATIKMAVATLSHKEWEFQQGRLTPRYSQSW